jgi:2-desacetyl-2-hydroxyethyl bacteriochlorophyllide A dehydrogenase
VAEQPERDGTRTASAVWFRAPLDVGIGEVTLPALAAGDVLVRSITSGISTGTELLAYRGELDPSLATDERLAGLEGTFTYPFRYGYSAVGLVEDTAADLPEGTLVFGFHPHQDRFVVSAGDVIVLPPGTDPRLGVLLPLVETALQVTLDAGEVRHEPVAVLGLGPVGLLTALLLRQGGADVLAVDPLPWRKEVAERLGLVTASADAGSGGDLRSWIDERTGGEGVPLLVEVSGNPSALAGALGLLAHEGTALVASWYGTKPVVLPLGGAFHRRRLVVRSTQVSTIPASMSGRWSVPRRRRVAVELLAALGAQLRELATHEFDFGDAAAAYAALDAREPGLLHAALRYG